MANENATSGAQRSGSEQNRDKPGEAAHKGGEQSQGAKTQRPEEPRRENAPRGGSGNFAEDRERANEAGRKGGEQPGGSGPK